MKMLDFLRKNIRCRFGSKSLPYQILSRLLNICCCLCTEGLMGTINLVRLQRTTNSKQEKLLLKSLTYPIHVRPGTDDIPAIITNIIRREWTARLPNDFSPKTIVDAGAFIGDTSLLFLKEYPGSFITALEPNKNNYELAKINLAPFDKRVDCLNAAIWHKDTKLMISGDSTHAHITSRTESVNEKAYRVEAISLERLISRSENSRLGLLKLDIEGAEHPLLYETKAEFLNRIDCIIAELHGSDITRDIKNRLRELNFSTYQYRSIWIFKNLNSE